MPVQVAEWLVRAAGLYLLAGTCFAVPFVIAGVGRIDPSAHAGTLGFRLIILPGVVLLWPLLLTRLVRRVTSPPAENTPHRVAAWRGVDRIRPPDGDRS
jgi:hypothetical protein